MSDYKVHEPKSKRPKPTLKRILLSLLIFPALMIFVFVVAGTIVAISRSSKSDNKQPATTTAIKEAQIGTTVNESGFSFVVNSLKCGEQRISYNDGLIEHYAEAQGQFCRLNMTVTNTGDSANSIRAYNQYVFNAQGQKYDYDAGATGRAARYDLGNPFNEDMNPGNSITGDVVFDVPVGLTPVKAQLHADSDSKGVSINLQ